MASPVIIDARNVLDPAQTRALGFAYYCTGRERSARSRPVGYERARASGRRRLRSSCTTAHRARRCDEYVAHAPEASAYHRPAWLDVIGRAFGHDTRYLVAESGGAIAGVLPLVFFRSRLFGRFAVSFRSSTTAACWRTSSAAARALVDRAIEETRQRGRRRISSCATRASCFRTWPPGATRSR